MLVCRGEKREKGQSSSVAVPSSLVRPGVTLQACGDRHMTAPAGLSLCHASWWDYMTFHQSFILTIKSS